MSNLYDGLINDASNRYAVPFALIKATIEVESNFNSNAMNYSDPGYAWGLMQMIPATARGLGYNGPMSNLTSDPALAIDLGTRLLAQNLKRSGSVADSVSAYNGGFRPTLGFGAKRSNGTYANQPYVSKVMAAYDRYSSGSFYDDFSDVEGGGSTSGTDVGSAPTESTVLLLALGLGVLWLLRAGTKGLKL